MDRSSKNRLTDRELHLFPGKNLFDKLARTVCSAGCLPRKELFEAWEVGRRIRRRFRGGRVVDLACGHGLLAWVLLLLDNSSSSAWAIDQALPTSAARLATALTSEWPHLKGKVHFWECGIDQVQLAPKDLVVSVHACGDLTDRILNHATKAKARLAVMPCCYNLRLADQGGFQGWLDGPMAVDVTRVSRLKAMGYQIHTQQIPSDITPYNRLLMAALH